MFVIESVYISILAHSRETRKWEFAASWALCIFQRGVIIPLMSDEELLKLPKGNYQAKQDAIVAKLGDVRPRLLLHACCAPCSSYCLEALLPHFEVTVFYYNPNITDAEEYGRRVAEIRRFTGAFRDGEGHGALLEEGAYDTGEFFEAVRGFENILEGGLRCVRCFRLRLARSAEVAAAQGFDFFTTTLTISPLKNASVLNALGEEIGAARGVAFLPSDFKKKDGYKRSTELSERYGLYRQDYCGCVYSKRERELQLQGREK